MTNLYGGQRARATRTSVYRHLYSNLAQLGWFPVTPSPNFTPITFIDEIPQLDNPDAVNLNTLALIDGNSQSRDIELGAYYGEEAWTFAVDFYAENDSVGLGVIRDVQKILEGRMPAIGCVTPIIPLYDYTQATPPLMGYLDVESISANRVSGPQLWQKYWFVCTFVVVDYNLA